MSKSMKNHIGILDTSDEIWEKLAPAKTDVQRVKRTDPGRPWVCNIYSYHEFFTPEEPRQTCYEECQKAGIGCIDCKKILHEHLLNALTPIQQRYGELSANPDEVHDFINQSAREAREIARETMDEVRHKMGLRSH
jgi:tryptophanyl-tRNA synthetase